MFFDSLPIPYSHSATTATNTYFPTNPTAPANTYVVKLGKRTFTATPGKQTPTWTAYTPETTRIANSILDDNIPNDTLVEIILHHGAWYIVRAFTKQRYKAKVEASVGIPRKGSGLVRFWENGLATSRTEYAYLNWLAKTTDKVSNGKEIIVQWYPDEGKWIIELAECE